MKAAQRLGRQFFNGWLIMKNYKYNRRGRIWVVWHSKVVLSLFYKSCQLSTCSVNLEGLVDKLICTFVYASNDV